MHILLLQKHLQEYENTYNLENVGVACLPYVKKKLESDCEKLVDCIGKSSKERVRRERGA